MSNADPTTREALHWRLVTVETSLKEQAVKVTGLLEWKSKVEDSIKEKVANGSITGGGVTGKDLLKPLIIALTAITSLIALLTKVL